MGYSYKGEPVRQEHKERTPICTPSGSPISSALSLSAVCEDACYNRNSYQGKCMKRTRSISEPAHKHDGALLGDHLEMNDVKAKLMGNSKTHREKQPNNVTASAIVTLPGFETVTVPNNVHEAGNRRYENCNDRQQSSSHTAIWKVRGNVIASFSTYLNQLWTAKELGKYSSRWHWVVLPAALRLRTALMQTTVSDWLDQLRAELRKDCSTSFCSQICRENEKMSHSA